MILEELAKSVVEGDDVKVTELTQTALQERIAPNQIIDLGLNQGMSVVARLFKAEEVYVSEVLMSARAMQAGLDVLQPILAKSPVQAKATAVIGTVHEDLHNIGKNLVVILLKGAGINVIDLGINVSPQRFIDSIRENKPDLVGMSCLLTTTMINMKKTMEALRESGLRDTVKVIVGGQPISQSFADQIGADAYACTAGEAVDVVRRMLAIV